MGVATHGATAWAAPASAHLLARRGIAMPCGLIGAQEQELELSMSTWPTWDWTSDGTRCRARTGGRRRLHDLGSGRASWRAPRAVRGRLSRGTEEGFLGRWTPRLHVVKQERPRVTAVLCRGLSPRHHVPQVVNLATLAGFPRALCERSSGTDRSGRAACRRPRNMRAASTLTALSSES